ncbi:hypothetical protein F5Y14DRAFT_224231 [Nemania sp. NC0429]|nr:hypothetical protein F5Y14DRAFT_224231 [Nemania sp. NC0429]
MLKSWNERATTTSRTPGLTSYNSPLLLCLVSRDCNRLSALIAIIIASTLSLSHSLPFCAGKREADVVTGGTALSTGHPVCPIHVVHAPARREPAPLFSLIFNPLLPTHRRGHLHALLHTSPASPRPLLSWLAWLGVLAPCRACLGPLSMFPHPLASPPTLLVLPPPLAPCLCADDTMRQKGR